MNINININENANENANVNVNERLSRHPRSRLLGTGHEKGVSIVIIIIVMTFMLTIGIALLSVTGTGPSVAGNLRLQQEAFNASEAGFDAAWKQLRVLYDEQEWTSFYGHYLQQPTGIDLPATENYFRKLTDEELLNLLDPDGDGHTYAENVIYFKKAFIHKPDGELDPDSTYTAFLIDDEAALGEPNSLDAILVCIGCVKVGSRLLTSRLEIELALETDEE